MEINSRKRVNSRRRKPIISSIKYILIASALLFFIPLLYVELNFNSNDKVNSSELERKLYYSMSKKDSRIKAFNRAIVLNNGKSINTCVYFLAEALRMNGENIDDNVCNTSQLLDIMKKEGFEKEKNYKKLKPGNICFTTDERLTAMGAPTHTFIFMGWKEQGLYDYAYICDTQANEYNGNLYHLRNITKVESVNGNTKEPFSFFMYK
jgi:tetratricopeptide (TPR) repeat protein